MDVIASRAVVTATPAPPSTISAPGGGFGDAIAATISDSALAAPALPFAPLALPAASAIPATSVSSGVMMQPQPSQVAGADALLTAPAPAPRPAPKPQGPSAEPLPSATVLPTSAPTDPANAPHASEMSALVDGALVDAALVNTALADGTVEDSSATEQGKEPVPAAPGAQQPASVVGIAVVAPAPPPLPLAAAAATLSSATSPDADMSKAASDAESLSQSRAGSRKAQSPSKAQPPKGADPAMEMGSDTIAPGQISTPALATEQAAPLAAARAPEPSTTATMIALAGAPPPAVATATASVGDERPGPPANITVPVSTGRKDLSTPSDGAPPAVALPSVNLPPQIAGPQQALSHAPHIATAAAAPPPALPMEQPMLSARPGHIGREMGIEIAQRVLNGQNELTIRLSPADMGRVEVRITFDERGSLRAVVGADNPTALDMLRRESGDLSRALNDAGVRADAQSFRFDGRGSDGGQSRQRQGYPGSDQTTQERGSAGGTIEEVTYRRVRLSGQIDLMA